MNKEKRSQWWHVFLVLKIHYKLHPINFGRYGNHVTDSSTLML